MMDWHVCLLTALLPLVNTEVGEVPSARGSPFPVQVFEGDDVLITCVVRSIGSSTVLWKREETTSNASTRWKILTAGHNRVTQDTRIQVIHDDGGDVWVLAIKNANMSDAGLYTCEVNSKPIVQTFHSLSVLPRVMTPPLQNATVSPVDGANDKPLNHNYTECCVALNVSQSCLGFCNIQSILDGTTGQDPEHCENDFPAIVRCMADGRNHVPCCVDEKVPDICQDVCRGEYTMITDNIKTHFSCAVYTEETLACIVEGIEILPSMPLNVQVTPLTDRSFGVEWTPPFKNSETVTEYTINVTMLRSFDPSSVSWSPSDGDNSSVSIVTPHRVQVNVKVSDNQSNDVVIKDLVPFTMYEISIVAKNKHGSSLPTNTVRALTLVPGQIRSQVPKKVPELPDTKQCCVEKGVTHDKCLNKLCSPSDITSLETADLMICAPWAGKTFSCLANGKDHTPCCKTRGLPDVCLDLCSGNVSQLNFAYFKCIKFIPTLRDCLMDGYRVLPSAPLRVRVSNIDIDFAIVNWDTPKMLGSTVIHYNVYYRPLESPDYAVVYEVEPPHILGNLTSSTLYEVFVAANNVHGTGDSSQRVLFSTESRVFQAKLETDTKGYNLTACCQSAGVSQTCMALCSFDAKMSNLKTLAGVCSNELAKLVKCGAGGRNHSPCCARRGVPGSCLPICSGVVTQSLVASAATCIPYIGNIVLCYEEGTNNIPGPVSELHAISVTNSEITLAWEPPKDGANATDYVIYYKKVDKTSVHETLLRLDNQKNTTKTVETLSNLEKGALYNVFVSARNEHGTSLPSSILLINVTKTELGDEGLSAVTSPPHSLAVSVHGAQYVTIAWQPPEFSHPAEQLVYRVFYKASSSQSYKASETSITSLTLDNLSPNTQYIIYVTAISKRGQSLPSETLIAWTDPAYPAFVEPPTVRPINLVVEGSSMTILCIAMGTPMPTVSLYISGRLVRQEVTRHMVTVIFNVTRDMNHISCYADNGYGTPMEARRRIIISYKPHITATGITMASQGDTVTLECSVEAHPDPQMIFWRDHEKRQPVIQDQKYSINIAKSKDEEDKWIMQLTIKSITESEGGDYFCHAENAFGNATQPVSVRLRNIPNVNNVTQCCKEQNVSNACQDACSFYLDIDAVIDKPECIGDFGKLMKCAADGSDHRTCCAQNGVDRTCLDWCRGEPLSNQDSKLCLVQHTKRIITCFKGGRERLPGPPQNVQIERIDDHSVLVKWALPVKNPHTAEIYRVFWKPAASNLPASKSDSKVTSLRVTGLKEGLPYEFSVKAINVRGASLPTEPLKFSTDEKYITSEASIGEEHSQYGVAMGLMFTVIFLVAIVCAAVWFVRNKNLLGHKSTGGNAFENPSYLREVNMDHIQPDANTSSGMSQSGWKQEHLHVPSSTEVAPSIYEELKLGHDGAGFKRLKP